MREKTGKQRLRALKRKTGGGLTPGSSKQQTKARRGLKTSSLPRKAGKGNRTRQRRT